MFTKTSTTSYIAVLIMVMGFLLLFSIAFIPTRIDEALKTQIVQGDWQIMTVAALYYFGQSKNRAGAGPNIGNAGEVNVTNPTVESPPNQSGT